MLGNQGQAGRGSAAKGLYHAQEAQGVRKQLWLEEDAAAGRRGRGCRGVAAVVLSCGGGGGGGGEVGCGEEGLLVCGEEAVAMLVAAVWLCVCVWRE